MRPVSHLLGSFGSQSELVSGRSSMEYPPYNLQHPLRRLRTCRRLADEKTRYVGILQYRMERKQDLAITLGLRSNTASVG